VSTDAYRAWRRARLAASTKIFMPFFLLGFLLGFFAGMWCAIILFMLD
jgi:hypothetical protein